MMFTALYVACFLAASSIASPTPYYDMSSDTRQSGENHNREASVTPFGSSMSSSDSSSYSEKHEHAAGNVGSSFVNDIGGAMGAMGGSGGGLSGSGGTQQSYTMSSATSSFQSFSNKINEMQSMLMARSMTQSMAYQQMEQLSQSFQMALAQSNSCKTCFSGSESQFSNAAASAMSQFTNLMSQMQTNFGSNFGSLTTPLQPITSSFQSFIQQAFSSSSRTSFQQNMPLNFLEVWRGIPAICDSLKSL